MNEVSHSHKSSQLRQSSEASRPSNATKFIQPDHLPTFVPANSPIEQQSTHQPDPFYPTPTPLNPQAVPYEAAVPYEQQGQQIGICYACHLVRPLTYPYTPPPPPPSFFQPYQPYQPDPPPYSSFYGLTFPPTPPPEPVFVTTTTTTTMSRGNGKKRNRPTKEVVERWKNYFGAGNLADWQRLCKDLGFEEVLGSKTKCREALRSINVNIWDFLDAIDEGRQPHMFPTKQELVRHTWSTGRVFPKSEAKSMGPVAALLKMLR